MKGWPTEWRDELHAIYDEALDNPELGTMPDRARSVLTKLADATQAHRPWVDVLRHDLLVAGLSRQLRQRRDSRAVVLVATTKGAVTRKANRGVRRVADDGAVAYQQRLIHEMTWDEVAQVIEALGAQLQALSESRQMMRKLDRLRELAPGAAGPAEAASRLGTTVDEFLARPERKAS